MTKELFVQAITKIVFGIILMGILLFIPAGTLGYMNGWLFMGVLFIPMFVAGVIMMFKNPELLKRRLNAKEQEGQQKMVILASALMFIAVFVAAGLNYRFSWIVMPKWSVYLAIAVFLLGYLMYAEVIKENEFLSRTIEVQDNQRVVDTGMYGIVRHPMYTSTFLLFGAMPWILGSPISFLIELVYVPIIIARIHNEEKVLKEGLPGYEEYCKKIKYRLIPFVY